MAAGVLWGLDAVRAALFGPVGRGAQWRAAGGALTMALFAVGSGVWLVGGPWA